MEEREGRRERAAVVALHRHELDLARQEGRKPRNRRKGLSPARQEGSPLLAGLALL